MCKQGRFLLNDTAYSARICGIRGKQPQMTLIAQRFSAKSLGNVVRLKETFVNSLKIIKIVELIS
jgi:hypothetical protein